MHPRAQSALAHCTTPFRRTSVLCRARAKRAPTGLSLDAGLRTGDASSRGERTLAGYPSQRCEQAVQHIRTDGLRQVVIETGLLRAADVGVAPIAGDGDEHEVLQ